jgi:hypothetical protein
MELFLVEGSGFFNPKTFEYRGSDLWLFTSISSGTSALLALQKLHGLGCKTSRTDLRGWNCLFSLVIFF